MLKAHSNYANSLKDVCSNEEEEARDHYEAALK